MNTEDILIEIREAIYNRFIAKQAANAWTNLSGFTVEETWRPYQELDKMTRDHPNGKVYILGLSPSDLINLSRGNTGQIHHPVMVGFQHLIAAKLGSDAYDTEISGYVKFVGELCDAVRLEIDCEGCSPNLDGLISFNRIEFLKDPNGLPFSFIMNRDANLFEAYFSVYYSVVLSGYETTTSTTTTTTTTT